MSCDLYRFYDADDQLLYVGISLHAAQRASEHRAMKPWWPDVARMDVEHFPTRSDALAVERAAIIAESPRWNIAHNGAADPSHQPWRCGHCLQWIPLGENQGIIQYPWAHWQVVCASCDDCDEPRYWIDSSRIATPSDLGDWTDHLSRKAWFIPGEWEDIMRWTTIPGAWRIANESRHVYRQRIA